MRNGQLTNKLSYSHRESNPPPGTPNQFPWLPFWMELVNAKLKHEIESTMLAEANTNRTDLGGCVIKREKVLSGRSFYLSSFLFFSLSFLFPSSSSFLLALRFSSISKIRSDRLGPSLDLALFEGALWMERLNKSQGNKDDTLLDRCWEIGIPSSLYELVGDAAVLPSGNCWPSSKATRSVNLAERSFDAIAASAHTLWSANVFITKDRSSSSFAIAAGIAASLDSGAGSDPSIFFYFHLGWILV